MRRGRIFQMIASWAWFILLQRRPEWVQSCTWFRAASCARSVPICGAFSHGHSATVLRPLAVDWRARFKPDGTLARNGPTGISRPYMPRYFFHLTNDIRTVVDTDGVQLEDEAALRREALEMVADLRKESHITGRDWSGWRVIVRDESGCDCFELKF